MPYAMEVRESLAALQCPNYSDSVWIGPFEQLAGAAYALLAAERHGFSRHDQHKYQYHAHVRENVAAWVAEEPFTPSDQPAFDDWVSGFYFNSALQRLVGAGEQLIATLSALECPCGKFPGGRDHGRRAGFRQQCQAAGRFLEHVRNAHRKDLPEMQSVVAQLSPDTRHRATALDPGRALATLYSALRQRQSHNHPRPESRAARPRARATWATASPEQQMSTACAALSQLGSAYNQLVGWQPAARESSCLALGATA